MEGADTTKQAYEDLGAAHRTYERILKAVVQIAKEERCLFSQRNLEAIMEGVGESLGDVYDWAVTTIGDECLEGSVYPDDSAKQVADAAEDLIDDFRIKPIDYSKMMAEILKPLHVSAETVESALHMANTELFRKMENDK